jgi:hypothetical protein
VLRCWYATSKNCAPSEPLHSYSICLLGTQPCHVSNACRERLQHEATSVGVSLRRSNNRLFHDASVKGGEYSRLRFEVVVTYFGTFGRPRAAIPCGRPPFSRTLSLCHVSETKAELEFAFRSHDWPPDGIAVAPAALLLPSTWPLGRPLTRISSRPGCIGKETGRVQRCVHDDNYHLPSRPEVFGVSASRHIVN